MKMNTQQSKIMGDCEGSAKSDVYRNIGLPKNDKNISNKQPNHTSTRTGGTKTNKAQSE